jgi:choline kinase
VQHGALIDRVTPGGPGDRAGLRAGSGTEIFQGQEVARGGDVVLAVDRDKRLVAENMKVQLSAEGRVRRINKAIPVEHAHGEYIGLALIAPGAAEPLAAALEATWRRDPSLYYEDGFQELVDRGGDVQAAAIGRVDWVEVDDDADLARAREIACRC